MQTAAKIVLEPIFEADLEDQVPTATGRAAARIDAVKSKCTDCCARGSPTWWTPTCRSISTRSRTTDLLRSVAARIVDRHVLRLITLWLKAPVEETGSRLGGGA